MRHVDRLMRQAIADRIFPGAVLLVSKAHSILFFSAYGQANLFSGVAMTGDTIFDLASLTKPLATTLAVMKLVEESTFQLEHQLSSIVPDFRGSDKQGIQLQHLLYHTSGLPDYRPYYLSLGKLPQKDRTTALRKMLLAEPLIHPTGAAVCYSDLGFMILRWVIEHVCGCRLDQFVVREIYSLLGCRDLYFIDLDLPPPKGQFAATEKCPWRRIVLEGQVHDENAYALGGIEGHAGLFGTAGAVHQLLSDLLASYYGQPSRCLFQQELVRFFFTRLAHTDKALGFDMPRSCDSSSGRYFSLQSVGHLGFTGTSFWMDLKRRIIVIFLTNRVHPSRQNNAIKAFRPRLHDTIMETLL